MLDTPVQTAATPHVAVYCGSSDGNDPRYVSLARTFGSALAHSGFRLVYGGGQLGLMGALAESVLDAGGHVTGIIPDFLISKEIGPLTPDQRIDLRIVGSMHERKALYYSLADAFVALPGGLGTFEELFEVAAWAHLGLVDAPVILVNEGGYFDPIFALLDAGATAGFVSARQRAIITSEPTSASTIARLRATLVR
jgi:uncharacterized protein (TIGR00730 family)